MQLKKQQTVKLERRYKNLNVEEEPKIYLCAPTMIEVDEIMATKIGNEMRVNYFTKHSGHPCPCSKVFR